MVSRRIPPLRDGWHIRVVMRWRVGSEGWVWSGENTGRYDRNRFRRCRYSFRTEAEAILAAKRSGADEVHRGRDNATEVGSLERDDEGRAKVEKSGVVVHGFRQGDV